MNNKINKPDELQNHILSFFNYYIPLEHIFFFNYLC